MDLSNAAANYGLDQLYDNKFPAGSTLRIRTGAAAGAENADTGTVLASITLPATPWSAAATGTKSKNGTWQDTSADSTGVAGHYRTTGTDTTMIEEGSCGTSGSDMNLDNTSINTGQSVTVGTLSRSL